MNDYNYDSYDWDSFIQHDAEYTQESRILDSGRDSFLPSPSMSQEPTPFVRYIFHKLTPFFVNTSSTAAVLHGFRANRRRV